MFTPVKPTNNRLLNDSIMNTPQPQATSTVQRKNIVGRRFSDESSNKEESKQIIKYETEQMQKGEDSSLGLLENISAFTNISALNEDQSDCNPNVDPEFEKQFKKLLQGCDDKKILSIVIDKLTSDINKENNVNVQNITSCSPTSNLAFPDEINIPDPNRECNVNRALSEASAASVTFEHNEITARSSGISRDMQRQNPLNKSSAGISFNSTVAEMLAQCSSEEFLSGSRMMAQLSADEALWRQNCTYNMPIASTEKSHELDFTAFSGITGQTDLSITSCPGKKVSIGQYFRRKCSDIGQLEDSEKLKISLGFASETPIRKGHLQPLIDSTIMTNATLSAELKKREHKLVPNITTSASEDSILSLSTIANTLEDVSNASPRRLVDQLLMAQKKKKNPAIMDNARKETYNFPSEGKMLATSAISSNKLEDISFANLAKKVSLNSTNTNENVNVKQQVQRTLSLSLNSTKETEPFINKEKIKEEIYDKNAISSINQDAGEVVLGKNTDQLCRCIVDMECEANIELINKGSRWIKYFLKLVEIRGDEQSIILNIPQDSILMKPNEIHSTKIEVKVMKMCKPFMAVLNIIMSDMVVESKRFMKHMICFNPEELQFDIICDSSKQELDFQCVLENTTKILPIILYNRNNIDVPVKLSILHLQDGPKVFSIDDTFKGMVKLNESRDELTDLIIKPHTKFTVNIKCKRSQSTLIDYSQKLSQCWKSKLILCVQCISGAVLLKKEVPLLAQIGICKIQVIDTDIPIVISRQQGKLLNIINLGNVTTRVIATIVPLEGHPNAAQNYSVKPDDISLEPGERSSFLIACKSQISDAKTADDERHAKIKLIAGNNVYCYIVSTEKSLESENDDYLRCETPCNLVSTSSPTSPQSVTSSRSGTSGKNSPNSMVSSIAENIIPIKTTHAALVWNSVRTGKSEIKEFTIRNMSNNKIKIQIDIWDDNKSFKFHGDRQSISTSMVLAMQRTESKTLAVTFSPYHVGLMTGKISIKHYTPARENSDPHQYKRIPLYGYGGYSKVKISDTFKDANGKMWLSLGTLFSGTKILSTNLKLQNTGDLGCFAKIKVIPKVISPTMDFSWHVNLKELILSPKESRQVVIEFHPKKEDFAILQRSEVSHIATINITYGDEPTRWRIRRLYNKMKESGELMGDKNEAFNNIVHSICKTFPNELLMPGLSSIRDSIQNLSDLCTGVHQNEIMLTVEAPTDDSLPILHDTDDESQMYYSLISDNSRIDEVGGASFFVPQMKYGAPHQDTIQDEHFTVTPPTVVLNPPVCNEATVTIFSFFRVAQPFQIYLSDTNYFSVFPAEGMLPSKQNFSLKIQCLQKIERNMQAVLGIYTENNKQDVLIKVNVKR